MDDGSSEDTGFNPRTRTGCDEVYDTMVAYLESFNPRTRTGCDGGEGGET
ncbi:hypothetical protein SSCH_2370001 [Syntrophaceticus schinkii]|uniref:Uncharacterized protein n=1 Tax=Syntrophaceticus schinkii TaxID=499207 RepID=A0A0B7ML34_9FIRM|nr:hypothetical protein SSCH_2370001 [Syntrophaceticus schinkii]